MRISASVNSESNQIRWSLINTVRNQFVASTLLAVAGFAGLTWADDPVSNDKQVESPASGVTIRLELQPSAPPDAELTDSGSAPQKNVVPPSTGLSTGLSTSRSSREGAPKHASSTPSVSRPLETDQRTAEPELLPAEKVATKLQTPAMELKLKAPSKAPPTEIKPQRVSASTVKLSDGQIDRDFSNERLESDGSAVLELSGEPDDLPLEQEEHPFDAPAAQSTVPQTAARQTTPPRVASRVAPVTEPSELSKDQFSARELRIKAGIQHCLAYYLAHPENTTRRGPWALMHTALPFGVESEVIAGGRAVNTIGWLSFNGTCGKQNMFQPTRTGFRPNVGPGVQGHEGQFLAILAQSRVQADYPLQINRRRYTIMDLARYEMATCREKSELTFKLIGLSYYLEPNQRWRDDRGHTWTLEKMVAEELAQPVNGAACGGVHRLMGLSYSLIQRQEAQQPITGHWQRAELYLNDYVNYAMSLQNPDGSFSTNWFESRGMDRDVERKVQTTGHILEWMVYTLPDDHLRSPRIQLALEFLLDSVGREPHKDWPIGPRGHALRAMALYSQRVFGARTGQIQSYVAEVQNGSQLR